MTRVEAVQFTGNNLVEVFDFVGGHGVGFSAGAVVVVTPEGMTRADPGDWIVKDKEGGFFPCEPDIFATAFEPVKR